MSNKFFLQATMVIALVACTNSLNAASYCAMPQEKQALDIRAMQAEMMVAAISCDQQKKYNAVLTKFEQSFANAGKAMKGYFIRNYHHNFENKMNIFITEIANESSRVSLTQDEKSFCKSTAQLFDKILAGAAKDIYKVASLGGFEKLHTIKSCSSKVAYLIE